MANAERVAAIYAEYQTLDPARDSPRILAILSEGATLIDPAAEPKKWGAFRLMYAQAAEASDPESAMRAYRESIPAWDPEKDRNPLVSCHFGLGALLFQRVASSASVEAAIPHLEFAAQDFPFECGSMLSLLYNMRQIGDPFENWKKRKHFLEITIANISPEENPAAWAARRNDLALALTAEPNGNFAAATEQRIANHLETLARLDPARDPACRRAFVQVCMSTSEAFGMRIPGESSENEASASRYARLAVEAATEEVPLDVRVQALLALGRALINQKDGDRRARLSEALDRFREAGARFDWNQLPSLAATIERFQAGVYLQLIELGDATRIGDLMAAAESCFNRLASTGDQSDRRTIMLMAAEGCIQVKQFARAIPCLERSVEAAEFGLSQAVTREGRLERIWDLHDAWALLAYCRLETGSIPEAIEALDRGKARLWQTNPTAPTAQQIRTLMPPGGAMLFPVFAGPRGAIAIACDSGWNVVWLEQFGKAQLRSLVLGDGVMPTLDNLDKMNGWVLIYATRRTNGARWRDLIDTIGDVLYREIWQPLQQRLDELKIARQSELLWFPQGASCVLPIHSARYQTAEGLRPITQDYALRYAPAASILLSAPQPASTSAPLLVANPQNNLPYSELELEWVKLSLAERAPAVLTRDSATRKAVLTHLPGAEIFHFSGHALFRLEDPFQSTLGLASLAGLSLNDLQPLLQQSPPRMVVLSACQTAMAQVTFRADEALGFPSMLLAHGVRTVIATLWPVDDFATALLMSEFYRQWNREKQPPAYALRSAQNWLRTTTAASISDLLRPLKKHPVPVGPLAAEARTRLFAMPPDSRPFAHPEFWAAFIIAGQSKP